MTLRVPLLLLLLGAAGLLTACEDATNVGADLVGAQGGQPDLAELAPEGFREVAIELPENLAPRLLAGEVEDPVLGSHAAQGYVDVTPISSADFRSGTLVSVELRLVPAYVYGDTTEAVTLALRDVTEDWDPEGLPPDTSFSVGPVIQEITFMPTDTLVVVTLPDMWVQEHDEVLRSTDLGRLFHGFRFEPVAGNAVVGFGPSGSSLVAETDDEIATMPFGRAYASITRPTGPNLPPNRVLMQAGTGPFVAFDIPVDDALGAGAVNRAALTLWADTLTLEEQVPEHFVRPALRTIDLFGITSSGSSALLARSTLDEEGRFVFDTSALARAMQDHLLGSIAYERFELRIPDPNTMTGGTTDARFYYTSLNPIIFFDTTSADRAPAVFLTVTPFD